ncbi:exodeoxyribonuclease VII small subunit [Kurthia sibirica]|uniref:Exodeoxyribonuclease 7 small subunit n=1 Tax=Kurthia sibirica TaxID=202750 RepID=A0A2U3ALW2_9BACL|nr:exodeoxyribonuclease VII small subunit [Kurthia sibirica]PWI25505.1 exodeoxyribonuclease VII small subunit [Kurthia sibirica]GEK33982.1 hypothetical protein KSI01_15150 [Kurthia sibirica]
MATKKQNFADSISQLEEIVMKLEKGEVPLEAAIELYQDGMKLSQYCHEQLEHAEKQLVTIMDDHGEEHPFTDMEKE